MDAEKMVPIESPRLLVRRLRDADRDALVAYHNDPEVARYQTWEGMTEAEGRAFIATYKLKPFDLPGHWGAYAVELKRTGELIGDLAFRLDRDSTRQGEIGFTFARAHQGHGFATEAVIALLDRAFVLFDLHRVVAVTDCKNRRCIALLERLGLRREAHFVENVWFKGKWGDEYLYALLRREWGGGRLTKIEKQS